MLTRVFGERDSLFSCGEIVLFLKNKFCTCFDGRRLLILYSVFTGNNFALLLPFFHLTAGLQGCISLTLSFIQKWCHSETPALCSAHFQILSFLL